MKSALKFRILVVLLIAVCSMNAQVYRIQLGYNNPVRLGNNFSRTFFNGIQLGGTAEYDLKNDFSLLTGVLYNFVYSDKLQKYPSSTSVKYVSYGHFLDIPLHVTYTYPFSKTLKAFGYAGPNINIGLFQNMNITSTLTYAPSSPYYVLPRSFNVYGSDPVYQLNRVNLQVGLGGGIQWKKYQLKAGYDFGINNLNKLDTGNMNQNGWHVTIGYSF